MAVYDITFTTVAARDDAVKTAVREVPLAITSGGKSGCYMLVRKSTRQVSATLSREAGLRLLGDAFSMYHAVGRQNSPEAQALMEAINALNRGRAVVIG